MIALLFLAVIALRVVVFLALSVWPSMLLIGALHDTYPIVPAAGFGTTTLIAALAYTLVAINVDVVSSTNRG
jgi:hypothetical protein